MRSRKLRWVVAGLALAALAVAGMVALWPQPDRITEENCRRIQKGMSRAEVKAILGLPGDYTTGECQYDGPLVGELTGLNLYEDETDESWYGDSGKIFVVFDAYGLVRQTNFWNGTLLEQSALARLRWRASRQWREWFPKL